MTNDPLTRALFEAICRIPIIDPHSHIDPRKPTARNLDDILGYHYYTELAHSAGLDRAIVDRDADPRTRVRAVLAQMSCFDNTVQHRWFVEIARQFLGFQGLQPSAADFDALWGAAESVFNQPDWEEEVLRRSNIETVFLTNDFDDPLDGFDTTRYVPCLRADDLVFHLGNPAVHARLARATSVEIASAADLRRAVGGLFEQFTRGGARACAISLSPEFSPRAVTDGDLSIALARAENDDEACRVVSWGVFWMLAEHCREFRLPFDLMIGVNRRVYEKGVYQGQDLFDQRTSLCQYARLFNAFPSVCFCVSVLSSGQNQELASHSWIFPNVVTSGHWWYSNIPAAIEQDARFRLQAAPKTKQIGYYSDMYKLEFALPKYNMYRRILAGILAEDFVRPGVYTEEQAVDLARLLLRENARRIFHV